MSTAQTLTLLYAGTYKYATQCRSLLYYIYLLQVVAADRTNQELYLVYKWFDYLKTQGHFITGYVIMPNHIHALIDFSRSTKKLNTVIGDGKRFKAYDIVKRLKEREETETLMLLENAVQSKDKANGHRHEVWKESFDWKYCETAKFAYQKLLYIHNNPCTANGISLPI